MPYPTVPTLRCAATATAAAPAGPYCDCACNSLASIPTFCCCIGWEQTAVLAETQQLLLSHHRHASLGSWRWDGRNSWEIRSVVECFCNMMSLHHRTTDSCYSHKLQMIPHPGLVYLLVSLEEFLKVYRVGKRSGGIVVGFCSEHTKLWERQQESGKYRIVARD